VYTHRGGVREHGLAKRGRLAVARPFVTRFAGLSANTRQSAKVLAEWIGRAVEDISLVYNGLDFQLLQPLRRREAVMAELPVTFSSSLIVGTAAKLQPLKRVDRLIEAVTRSRENVRCVVLGDGPSRATLERLAHYHGIGDRVAFVGRQETVADYLQIFDLFVLPSGPEEAFGNAAVEAMGVGVPTIVFADGGGLTEHIENGRTGRVVRDVSDLTSVLDELAADEPQRRALGSRGRAYVRSNYSLEKMFDRYDALYRRALSAS
jgi:glycosyltransferase involved in cell wall biosynthesis